MMNYAHSMRTKCDLFFAVSTTGSAFKHWLLSYKDISKTCFLIQIQTRLTRLKRLPTFEEFLSFVHLKQQMHPENFKLSIWGRDMA